MIQENNLWQVSGTTAGPNHLSRDTAKEPLTSAWKEFCHVITGGKMAEEVTKVK